ncbi:MAG: helix-turn-helix domain-containing protein [Bacteroidales bacterium]|nr:helix-turn-helix domain-containing protein [Bacteroidales bacterium]
MDEPLSLDQAFIKKLIAIILDNLMNEQFGVEELSHQMGMSHTTIHRKLRVYTHKSVSQFIREVRLQKANEMLQQNLGTVSEISYRVGFGSPTYFNKCFHEYYGYPPGDARNKSLSEKADQAENHKEGTTITEQIRSKAEKGPVTWRQSNLKMIIVLAAVILVAISLALVRFLLISPNGWSKDLSMIVLPFKNISDDPGNQYFADGIMEDILNNLNNISGLRVVSRTTSEHFRGTTLTSREIAREANARYVLESSIRRQEDLVRISVQLIDAHRDQHLWSENFDRELTDIFGFQSDIALNVAQKLNAVLSETEMRQIKTMPTLNPVAYDYYLRGRFLLNKSNDEQRADISQEGLTGSLKYFEMAIAADTNFAEAYACLASAWFNLAGWGWIPKNEGFPKARELSLKALELDPGSARAHCVRGDYLMWAERKFEEARKELMTTVQLNPDYPPVYQNLGQLLMVTGPIKEARKYVDRGLELEPYFWVMHNLSAYIYYFEGKYSEAITACHDASDLHSGYIFTNWLLFLSYARLGDADNAALELSSIVGSHPQAIGLKEEIAAVADSSGVAGLFSWLIEVNINRPVPLTGMSGHPFFIAWWQAILGNKEEAIYWLERNMEAKLKLSALFDLITTNPDFNILHSDPRFMAIIEKRGLASYSARLP